MAETEERIDKSHWLPAGESIITPERAKKGDIRSLIEVNGQIQHANAAPVTVLVDLFQRRVLTSQHLHCGQLYEAWRYWFLYPMSHKPNRLYSSREEMRQQLSGSGLETKDDEDWDALQRKLNHAQRRLIVVAVSCIAKECRWALLPQHNAAYRNAFDRLSDLLEPMLEQARKRREEG